jgi:hypothetical protein
MKLLVGVFFLITACVSEPRAPISPNTDTASEAVQREMCVEENIGVLRFSRSFLEKFCPGLKSQTELTCFRFVHATKEWRKACVGVDTADKLECIATIQNGPSYALLESLQKCRIVANRKQILCLSRAVAKSGVPLQPETVQACLDQNL